MLFCWEKNMAAITTFCKMYVDLLMSYIILYNYIYGYNVVYVTACLQRNVQLPGN